MTEEKKEENKEKDVKKADKKQQKELNPIDKEAADKLKRYVKALIVAEGYTMEKLSQELNKKYPTKESKANLSNKLKRGFLRYIDMQRITDVLGYDIEIKKR